ncbi:tetratricopeptide repeat protein [Variovorax sp. Sphag1AA]|uniref:tetratricopeptide repeat protein n=1 Tax=Variovorax sp. Sphag1AA TaxID=2587027 RepID=UPI001620FDE0|nr:tetratricopeptide repeat protein [Variovorax sp. Sphag1AA]MBB3176192.1 tetratricopeptide (TPR) repeat protein [Variovorax sp. Sphag1AA]
MSLVDHRGCSITGATPEALAAYERALTAFQGWRTGADAELEIALAEAPAFVMAHVLRAYQLICSRDPRQVRQAHSALARATALESNGRERMHLAAIATVLADDYEGAKVRLGELLDEHPRDALALQVAHAFDHVTGDEERMRDRVSSVLPAWSRDLPGYHTILSMHAFSLEESGEYARAQDVALSALELDPHDARAHHAMAHIFEMTEQPDAGVRWMRRHIAAWSEGTIVATHCWWHLALFHLARAEWGHALALYDQRVRAGHSTQIADLIDAAALLWRLDLHCADLGMRWAELAAAWASHIDDGFCSFNDLHAALAFVGAHEWGLARRLETSLIDAQSKPTRHGSATRELGLASCRAMMAFGRGDDTLAVTLLASLPALAHRLGGSHAQRDVLHLTLREAVERICAVAHRSPQSA